MKSSIKVIPNFVMQEFQKNPKIGRIDLAKKCNIPETQARNYVWLYSQMNKNLKLQGRGVALFDLHYPDHDRACFEITLEFIKDFKPNWIVLGGDQLDLGLISSYNKFKLKTREGKRLYQDYRNFQKDILDRLEEVLPKNCKRFFMMGNHEYRIERLLEKHPEYEGLIEIEKHLKLDNWKIIPFNDVFNIGHMHFTHGWYWNKYYAEKTLRIAQKMIFCGHVHTPQVYTAVSPAYTLPKMCIGLGCLCNKNPDYLEDKPNYWVHQFLYWYSMDDGSFTYYTPVIVNGRCVINGKLYDGNRESNIFKFNSNKLSSDNNFGDNLNIYKNKEE